MENVVVDRYYIVKLEDIGWCELERTANTYNEGRDLYKKIKDFFIDVPCKILFISYTEYEDGTGEEKIIWSKQLGKENDIRLMYELMYETIRQVKIKFHAYMRSQEKCEEFLFDFDHALEKVDFEKTSGEQRDDMLFERKMTRIKRRIIKAQLDVGGGCKEIYKSIMDETDRALGKIKSLEKAPERIPQATIDKYFKSLNLTSESLPLSYDIESEKICSKEDIIKQLEDSECGTLGELFKQKALKKAE